MYLHLIINKKLFFNQNNIFNKLFVNNFYLSMDFLFKIIIYQIDKIF